MDDVSRRDQSLAALVAVIWGFNFVVIDWGMGEVPPLLFLAARFLAVVVPAVFLLDPPPVPWRTVAAVGTFMSLGQFAFLYVAMDAGMPPGLAGLVLQAQVVLTILIAAAVLRERPTRPQVLGVVLGVAGLVVVGLGRGGHVPAVALLLCLSAALMWAIGNVVSRASGATGGLSLTVWSALVVPVPLVLLSLVVDGPAAVADGLGAFGWRAAVSTLYTAGLASLVGYGIFNTLLSRNPSAAVVPWILLVPPVAIGSAWALLDEVPAPAELVGGAVLVLGVAVSARPMRIGRDRGDSATNSDGAPVVSAPTRCTPDPSRPGSPGQPAPAGR
ncbi:EamA family transporter [Nocardioides sp. SLBN-35]|uniref:EamA family transporter n=1 Tax=Nocardioides sp. SLBN-35 TaxID=2768445 RepID=UPI00116DDE47|nr:EamA family transporter [Nocardioides sp. SLBN-35]TQK71965.1 O-acetylserine/cysteine efflux transporter [Nocardioides sp. SLBN-35]